MKISVINTAGAAAGEIEVADEMIITTGKGTQAVHDAVVAFRANQRLGTHQTKMIGDVAGSGKKPWKQKGTGRARFGSSRNPIWRGGGIAFGPNGTENHSIRLSTTSKRVAIRQALTLANKSKKCLTPYRPAPTKALLASVAVVLRF